MLTSCWARYRYEPNSWPISSSYWNDIEDFVNNDNGNSNNVKESDFLDKFLPVTYRAKNALHGNVHSGDQDRRKKFLSDSTNIQGLWAMPGRR